MSRLPSSAIPSAASSPPLSPPHSSRHGSPPAAAAAAAAGEQEALLSCALQGLEIQESVSSAGKDGNKAGSSSSPDWTTAKKKPALNPFAREFVPGSSPSSSDQGFDTIGDSELVLDQFKTEICHQGTHEALKNGEEFLSIGNTLETSEGLSTVFKREQTGYGRLSGTLKAERAGHGVLDTVQSTVTGTPPTGKRSQFVNANHLLNFQYDPIPRLPPRRTPPTRRQHRPQPYNKELFLQANFRFLVSDFGDYVLNASDPDRMIQWEDIAAVNFSAAVPVQCPICLECPPLCAQITSCGHIFCFPCILRYLLMGEEGHKGDYAKKCPLCFAMVSCKDLRTVFIDDVQNYQVGDFADFTLLTRAKGSVIPFEISDPVLSSLPYSEDGQCHHFSKFTLTSDAEQTTKIAIAELSKWAERSEKGGEDLELLPYVCAAIDQLQQRQVSWGEHRILEFLSSSPPVRQRIIAQAKTGLTKLPIQGLLELDTPDLSAEITKKGHKKQGEDVVDVTAETEAAMAELRGKAGWVYEKAFSDEEDSNKIENRIYRISQLKGNAFDQSFQKDTPRYSNICADLDDVPSTWENLLEDSEVLRDVERTTDVEKKSLGSKKDLDDTVSYNFYQSADGQSLMLHPLNMKCLLHYYGSYGKLPLRLEAKILEMEMITQTEATRKRYRHLSHLPLTTNFQLCEVDLKHILPSSALSCVIEELESRENRRRRRLKQEQDQKAKEERVSMASVPRLKIPVPSEFMGIMDATHEEEVMLSNPEESIHDPPGTEISPPLDERRLFSHVTKLGFASAHDAPALGQLSGNEAISNQWQSSTLVLEDHLQNGSTDERVSRTSAMSFADVIQAQPPKLTDSDSSGNSAVARNSSRKSRRNSKVLLSTAGGRRY